MDERLRFVARFLEGEKMAALCREFDISRKTGYKIFERYNDYGVHGLTDRSRRPYRHANKLPVDAFRAWLEDWVRQKVESGLYNSSSEVVREALRLMQENERLRAARLDQLRGDIREGLDSGPARAWNPDEIKREGRAKRAGKARTSKV